MKKTKILYWVFTGLFSFVMLGSAIPNILVDQMSVDGFNEMGLPAYLVPFIGWAKLFGVIAILVPGYPRLKEWAYAGLFIDLVGATYCIYSAGKTSTNWLPMLLFIGLGAASYIFYLKKQRITAAESSGLQASNPLRTAY
ncbi:DoxX family protein [Larkinella harenae]